jgi:nucleoid-associated protein YgaU
VNFVEFRRPTILAQRKGKGIHLPANVLVRTLPAKRDTLYELAKFYYGSASKWRVIHKANRLHIPPSLNLKKHFRAQKQKKLRIPKLS